MTSDPHANPTGAGPTGAGRDDEATPTGPTVHDHRRIDPQTGQPRPPRHAAEGAADGGEAETTDPSTDDQQVSELKAALADRTSDLQRLQAEYVNYKRRIDRDRDLARTGGIEAVLRELLTVLDTIRSAREHEEMSAGFRAVSEEIERVGTRYGLESYGEAGDEFDPHVHEALMHSQATEVNGKPITTSTCVAILQPGYKIKDKVIRPARVAVAEPSAESGAAESGASDSASATAADSTPNTAPGE